MNQKFEKGEMTVEKAVFFALREFVYAAAGVHLRRTEQLQARHILRQLELDPWASMETGEEEVTFVRGVDDSVKEFINEHHLVEDVSKKVTLDPARYVPIIVDYLGSSAYHSVWLGGAHPCRWYKTYKRVVKTLNSLIQ